MYVCVIIETREYKENFMLDYIKGFIEHIDEKYIVIECNDIGYKIMTSLNTISEVSHHTEKVCIYTQMVVREDSITLCGFATQNELKMFNLLTSVSGVGTKVAVAILSSIQYTSLYSIITLGDAESLTKANGVGKKTAQRIILELKDKVKKVMHLSISHGEMIQETFELENTNYDDAKAALVSLGYTHGEINGALGTVETMHLSTEDIIKLALKNLMNR